MHSLLWNMPHSWYAHMIILQCHSYLGGSWSQKIMPKSYTSAKSLPWESLFKMCLLDLVKAYVSPKNVSSAYILTNTEKQIKLSLPKDTTLGELLLHNYQVIQNTANRAFPRLKTCFAADTSERCERSLPLIKHLENSPTIWRAPYMYKYPY